MSESQTVSKVEEQINSYLNCQRIQALAKKYQSLYVSPDHERNHVLVRGMELTDVAFLLGDTPETISSRYLYPNAEMLQNRIKKASGWSKNRAPREDYLRGGF